MLLWWLISPSFVQALRQLWEAYWGGSTSRRWWLWIFYKIGTSQYQTQGKVTMLGLLLISLPPPGNGAIVDLRRDLESLDDCSPTWMGRTALWCLWSRWSSKPYWTPDPRCKLIYQTWLCSFENLSLGSGWSFSTWSVWRDNIEAFRWGLCVSVFRDWHARNVYWPWMYSNLYTDGSYDPYFWQSCRDGALLLLLVVGTDMSWNILPVVLLTTSVQFYMDSLFPLYCYVQVKLKRCCKRRFGLSALCFAFLSLSILWRHFCWTFSYGDDGTTSLRTSICVSLRASHSIRRALSRTRIPVANTFFRTLEFLGKWGGQLPCQLRSSNSIDLNVGSPKINLAPYTCGDRMPIEWLWLRLIPFTDKGGGLSIFPCISEVYTRGFIVFRPAPFDFYAVFPSLLLQPQQPMEEKSRTISIGFAHVQCRVSAANWYGRHPDSMAPQEYLRQQAGYCSWSHLSCFCKKLEPDIQGSLNRATHIQSYRSGLSNGIGGTEIWIAKTQRQTTEDGLELLPRMY